jgi:UPF0755 protein
MTDRTPSEREQARLEREARRAKRNGQAAPPAPPPPHQPPARDPVPPEPPPPYEPPAGGPPPERPPARPAPRAAPVRRSAAERRAAATEFLRHRRGGPASPAAPRRRWRLVAGAGGALALLAAWFLLSMFQPFHGDGSGEVRVTIPNGAGAGQIADILEERGVISSAFFFRTRLAISGGAADLKPGRFDLRRDMSNAAAAEAVSTAPDPNLVTLTIPEGLSRTETDGIVDGLRGDYLAASRRSPRLDPRGFGAEGATSLEGFLFPATYELRRGRHVRELVAQQLEAFEREVGKVSFRYARRKNLTEYDVLTIASMVEREAQLPRERRLVASVIYNRLKDGMHLGIDATIRFAVGNWTEPLTQSQLATDSPYNTRTNPGLPPGPIGNPGLAAIRAAARPAETDYLFYVVKPGTCGEHAFSATDAEFQQDVERYNTARAARGGKSPTDC